MKFLLDTNAIIPAEPTSSDNVEELTSMASRLIGLLSESQQDFYIHPASIQEMNDDFDLERRKTRLLLIPKYVPLPSPPPVPDLVTNIIGPPPSGVHGQTDHLLISAVVADAVDFLVTEDKGIHRKAARLGIRDRVLSICDAFEIIYGLIHLPPSPPPAVERVLCHELDQNDPIFESLREDYADFDKWLRKIKREHRTAFLIKKPSGSYDGIAIVKDTTAKEQGTSAVCRLKICTFKVDENSRGFRYGELLLKSIFCYAESLDCHTIYCTCFPKQESLINLLEDFGFEHRDNKLDELILQKRLTPTQAEYDNLDPLEYHVRFGPSRIKAHNAPVYIIPIKPSYHRLLFPELETQMNLFAGETVFGNSIRKAYLCNAQTQRIAPGSLLLFYRSHDSSTIRVTGVVDASLRSSDPMVIARFVGRRTVYSLSQIESMCHKEHCGRRRHNEVLATLFRQAKTIPEIGIKELVKKEALKGAPQSVTRIKNPKALQWIQKVLER